MNFKQKLKTEYKQLNHIELPTGARNVLVYNELRHIALGYFLDNILYKIENIKKNINILNSPTGRIINKDLLPEESELVEKIELIASLIIRIDEEILDQKTTSILHDEIREAKQDKLIKILKNNNIY